MTSCHSSRTSRAAAMFRASACATSLHHYELFGGVSPINAQNRDADRGTRAGARWRGIDLPSTSATATGIRSSTDTMRQMTEDGVARARRLHVCVQLLLGVPSVPRGSVQRATGGRAGCAEVRERACSSTTRLRRGERRACAPLARARRGRRCTSRSRRTRSRPRWRRARATRCSSERRRGSSRTRSASRTGRSSTRAAAARRACRGSSRTSATICEGCTSAEKEVVISPIGFVSDHLEVLFDLDPEAREIADELGLPMAARRDGRHASAFVAGLADLIVERMTPADASGPRSAGSGRATTSARPTAACRARAPSPGTRARRARPAGRASSRRRRVPSRQHECEDPNRDDHDRLSARAHPDLNLVTS